MGVVQIFDLYEVFFKDWILHCVNGKPRNHINQPIMQLYTKESFFFHYVHVAAYIVAFLTNNETFIGSPLHTCVAAVPLQPNY